MGQRTVDVCVVCNDRYSGSWCSSNSGDDVDGEAVYADVETGGRSNHRTGTVLAHVARKREHCLGDLERSGCGTGIVGGIRARQKPMNEKLEIAMGVLAWAAWAAGMAWWLGRWVSGI